MRFALDLVESESSRSPAASLSSSVSKRVLEWVPLQNHPLFSTGEAVLLDDGTPSNLIAWDGASRLYLWDCKGECLHRISVRLGEPDPSSVIAASPSKILRPDPPLNFDVNKIAINRNGSALLLVGLEGVQVMYLYGRSSVEENAIICRTFSIGTEIYFNINSPISVLQISWHPFSDTHLGVLSSDSAFRIFDLFIDIGKPEQEFYLQAVEPSSCAHAAAICPVDFSFGADHLWDKFSVFILFSDGSCYIICAVVPFGSAYKWESIFELYHDAQTIGLKSSDPEAGNHVHTAISWLEGTFPELLQQPRDGGRPHGLKARPFALLNSSVALQGPLHNIRHERHSDGDKKGACRAVSFLYNLVGKDTILVTAWGDGQLQVDALADEIQPLWNSGSAPRIFFSSSDQILGAAMICEAPSAGGSSLTKLDDPQRHFAWSGHPPPLLRLAVIDLALSKKPSSSMVMIPDPLVRERIFCIHEGGIDSIVLHFLPCTNMSSGKDEKMRPPSVLPVLTTGTGDASLPPPLCGCLPLSDSFGTSWIVGITCLNECVVLQLETWNVLLSDIVDKMREVLVSNEEKEGDPDAPYTIISKELLLGPRPVLLPAGAASSRDMSADSIEGRSFLHQYFNLFHENYVEYAHKVYFELQHHGPHVKNMIESQWSRLREMQRKLSEVERKQVKIEDQIDKALKRHSSLEERLLKLRNLSGSHKKPLSKAEKQFKSELDRLSHLELDSLHFAIEAVNARLKKHLHSPQGKSASQRLRAPARSRVDDDVSQLKASLEKLSFLNGENSRKVELIESTLNSREIMD